MRARTGDPSLYGPAVVGLAADGSQATKVYCGRAFSGGVRVATADFSGDGIPDLAIGSGPGTQAHVEILDGVTGQRLFSTDPFVDFTGGVFVAVGDLTGDGRPDLVVTPDQGGGPRVEIIDGTTFVVVANFFGIEDQSFRGGARAAVGDVTGDGAADLVIAAGFGGGPRISCYDGTALHQGKLIHPLPDFFLFEETLRNGAYVAVGDVDGDGLGDLIGGGGPGGGPRVLAVSGRRLLAEGGGESPHSAGRQLLRRRPV